MFWSSEFFSPAWSIVGGELKPVPFFLNKAQLLTSEKERSWVELGIEWDPTTWSWSGVKWRGSEKHIRTHKCTQIINKCHDFLMVRLLTQSNFLKSWNFVCLMGPHFFQGSSPAWAQNLRVLSANLDRACVAVEPWGSPAILLMPQMRQDSTKKCAKKHVCFHVLT